MGSEFNGNIPVSMAKGVYWRLQNDREQGLGREVVDKVHPIQNKGFPTKTNSAILYEGFPEEFAVKGLLHDASVNLFSSNADTMFSTVNKDLGQVVEFLEGSVEGRRSTSPQIVNRISQLERNYGIEPDQILDYQIESKDGKKSLRQLLRDIAETQVDRWADETSEYYKIEPEVTIIDEGISGRADLLLEDPEGVKQLREEKLSENIRETDIFQISAYWLIEGDEETEAVLEYPLIDERLTFDPDSDSNDFEPRNYSFDVYNSRDKAIEVIEDLRELQQRYFEFYDDREKATREALKDLEVKNDE